MTKVDILRAALELLADPSNWTQRAYARDNLGRNCATWSPNACQWCMEGALYKVGGNSPEAVQALRVLYLSLPASEQRHPYRYNDAKGRKHSEIIAVMRQALALAEAEEAA
jgi:hypothetical protein